MIGKTKMQSTLIDASRTPIPIEDMQQFFLDLLVLRERVLATELNWVREQLGKNPRRCPKCGEELK